MSALQIVITQTSITQRANRHNHQRGVWWSGELVKIYKGKKMCKVVHCKKEKCVYIGRPSKWGNPFEIGRDGNRAEVIQKYKEWITEGNGKHLLADLHELKGQTLGCWCAPQACHGDILMELANK